MFFSLSTFHLSDKCREFDETVAVIAAAAAAHHVLPLSPC
jgi:hypothetical protein